MSTEWVLVGLAVLVATASLVLTGGLRRYALANGIVDIPNERSSHSVPIPRGGGLAIVFPYLAVLPVLGLLGWLPWIHALGLLGAGAVVAAVGFLDDRSPLPAHWRLLVHFLAVAWLLAWLSGLPQIVVFGATLDFGAWGYVLGALYLVWLINLYNFMDGIDGIAAIEAITCCLGGALLYVLIGEHALAAAPLLLATTVAGFLYWNFPPAKIFMGDAGSGFLGLVIAGMAVQAAWVAPQLFWAWTILLAVFIVDATFTLIRRLLRGDKVYQAHRTHAYQYASRKYCGHRPVALAVLAINGLWLTPWAVLATLGYLDGAAATVFAYLPLIGLAAYFRAGANVFIPGDMT